MLWSLSLLVLMTEGTAAAALQPDLMIRLGSESDAAYLGSGVFESTATVQSKSQAAFEGRAAVYRILLRNAGDVADSFVLKGTGSGNGFTVRYLDDSGNDRGAAIAGGGYATAAMAPGESISLQVEVSPSSITPGASFRVSISAASAADPSRTDQVKSETVACGSTAAVTVSAPPDGSGMPESVVKYPYTVTNVGSGANTFALSVSTANGWRAVIQGEDGGAIGSTGPLAPGASFRFFVAVTVPPSSLDGARAATTLTIKGSGDANGGDEVVTTALAATLSVAESVRNLTLGGPFQTTTSAFPGDTLEYRMSITNSGSAPATAVSIDSPLPTNTVPVPGTLWIGTSSSGEGSHCSQTECGAVREGGGNIIAYLGQGASDSAGGALPPGKTLYLYFRVQVE